MSPGKKRVAKKATTLAVSMDVDADEDDRDKSPIRPSLGASALSDGLSFSYQRLVTGWRVFFQNVSNLQGFITRRTTIL